MAILDITEYLQVARDGAGGAVQTGMEPAVTTQQVAVGAGSVQSAALQGVFVRVHTDVACRLAFGANPTAASTSQRMAANATEFFGVRPGDKIAVIQSA